MDALCSERPVVILLLRSWIRLGVLLGWLGLKDLNGIFVCRIDIILFCGYEYLRLVASRFNDSEVRVDFIVAFRSPGNVMDIGKLSGISTKNQAWEITYGVNVEYIDIRR